MERLVRAQQRTVDSASNAANSNVVSIWSAGAD